MAEQEAAVRSRLTAAHRRRQSRRHRKEAIFPAQEGMPVLRREDRRHQLQGREAAAQLRGRARQDHAPPHLGRVRAAPAAADATRSRRRATSRCCRSRRSSKAGGTSSWKSFSEKTSTSWAAAAQVVKVAAGLRPQFPAAETPGRCRHRLQQEDRRAGTPGASAQGSQSQGRSRGSWPS